MSDIDALVETVRAALNHSARQTTELVEFGDKYAATRRQFRRQFGDRAWNIHLQPGYAALTELAGIARQMDGSHARGFREGVREERMRAEAERDRLILENEACGNALVDTEIERDRLKAALREITLYVSVPEISEIARAALADVGGTEPDHPDPSSHGGHPYTPTERAMGYGTADDPRFGGTEGPSA